MKEYRKIFSKTLSELMADNSLNNLKLSKNLGVANTTVGKWINCLSIPSLDSIIKIADYFHTSIDYLFDKTDTRYFFVLSEKNFVNNFEVILRENEIKKKKIFSLCNISNSELYLWQSGGNPSLDTLLSFSDFLNLPIEYIIGRTDKTVL